MCKKDEKNPCLECTGSCKDTSLDINSCKCVSECDETCPCNGDCTSECLCNCKDGNFGTQGVLYGYDVNKTSTSMTTQPLTSYSKCIIVYYYNVEGLLSESKNKRMISEKERIEKAVDNLYTVIMIPVKDTPSKLEFLK